MTHTDQADAIRLTPRERQVCEAVCLGLQNREIAMKFGCSHRTIEDHRAAIFRKYEVHNAVELVRAVYQIPTTFPESAP